MLNKFVNRTIGLIIFSIQLLIVSTFSSENYIYWKNVERTELFEMMEESIPQMYISIPNEQWKEMIKIAQVKENMFNVISYPVKANLKFVYKGNEEFFKIKIKVGGHGSARFTKPGYNVKIIDKNRSLHGTKNFRLRSDPQDPTMMRSKLVSEILQKSGLITIEIGYTELYINNIYMGFFVVNDSITKDWIIRKFNGTYDNILRLVKCHENFFRFENESAKTKCVNKSKDVNSIPIFNDFVDKINNAKNINDLNKIIDVNNFIKYMAWEYLIGSWDHFLGYYGHNFFWFQQSNNKWVYIPFDYGEDGLGINQFSFFYPNKPFFLKEIDFSYISFKEFELNHPIISILIHRNDNLFRKLLGDIISKVFNPDILFNRIEYLKNYISPYVKKDRKSKTGKINKAGINVMYTFEHFLKNSEYTYIHDEKFKFKYYGLKEWIHKRYLYVSFYYGINTNATSLNEKHKLIEPRPDPIIIPYSISFKSIKKRLKNIYYIEFNNTLPVYCPNKSYFDDSAPYLDINLNDIKN